MGTVDILANPNFIIILGNALRNIRKQLEKGDFAP